MSLYITQQQIYLNVSMLLLSRSGCMLQFKPVSGSHALLPDAPSTSGPSKRPGKENEVQLYRQSTDLSRTVSLAIHVKKTNNDEKTTHKNTPNHQKNTLGDLGFCQKAHPIFISVRKRHQMLFVFHFLPCPYEPE